MSTEQNKAVVRRFISDFVVGANWGAADELLAPNYVNAMMPGLDRAGFKAAAMGLKSVIQETRVDNLTLIAEGDDVVARFDYGLTLTNGKKLSARNLTYYRLANGKIAEDEPMSTPDLFQEIAGLMAPPAGS
jgi:ketosteroid isomerase-like protein